MDWLSLLHAIQILNSSVLLFTSSGCRVYHIYMYITNIYIIYILYNYIYYIYIYVYYVCVPYLIFPFGCRFSSIYHQQSIMVRIYVDSHPILSSSGFVQNRTETTQRRDMAKHGHRRIWGFPKGFLQVFIFNPRRDGS